MLVYKLKCLKMKVTSPFYSPFIIFFKAHFNVKSHLNSNSANIQLHVGMLTIYK